MAAPTAAPPTTARRVTPAPLTGVNGRPTRACALVEKSERPSVCNYSGEPKTPHATTAATKSARFKSTRFIATSIAHRRSTFHKPAHASFVPRPILRKCNWLQCNYSPCSRARPPVECVSEAYACVARSTQIGLDRLPRYRSAAVRITGAQSRSTCGSSFRSSDSSPGAPNAKSH